MEGHYRQFCVALSLLLLGATAAAQSDRQADGQEHASVWLDRMAHALGALDYQGTFVYAQGDDMQSFRITHVVRNGEVQERLYSVTGPEREVIRQGNQVRCRIADDQPLVLQTPVSPRLFPVIPADQLVSADDYYQIELGSRHRVAGHTAQRVDVQPTDSYRYGYRLWLEENTGLLLKSIITDADGAVLARLMFTDVRMGDSVDTSELRSEMPLSQFQPVATAMASGRRDSRGDPRWQPGDLPEGFRLTAYNHEQDGDSTFEHMVYSDGIAAVSVYVEQADEGDKHGATRMGTTHAYTLVDQGLRITVIGEVPAHTTRRLAESVTASDASLR